MSFEPQRVGSCKHGFNFMSCYFCESERKNPPPLAKAPPSVGELLDAVVALLVEQQATGVINPSNLSGVRKMIGEYRSAVEVAR